MGDIYFTPLSSFYFPALLVVGVLGIAAAFQYSAGGRRRIEQVAGRVEGEMFGHARALRQMQSFMLASGANVGVDT